MIIIYEGEVGFILKDGNLKKILKSGKYNFFSLFSKYKLNKEFINKTYPEYNGEFKEILLNKNKNLIEENFYNFDIGETEIGILYKNGKIYCLLKGNKNYLFWKGFGEFNCEMVDISKNIEISKEDIKKFKTIDKTLDTNIKYNFDSVIFSKIVNDYQKAILKINGEFKRILEPGEYMFYNSIDNIEILSYDIRNINLDVSGQEILTKDKIGIRINLSLYYKIYDLEKFYKTYSEGLNFIYTECQLSIRGVIGEKTLDELLENKKILSENIKEVLVKKIDNSGIKIISIGIKDVILPGEMRIIVNKVIEAEKKSQINTIKRRDETASTRSLLNTSKLLEKNPILMRLKELETLENLIEKVGTVNISNGIDGFLKDFLKIGDKV